ncbi:uncharacterized protein LOC119500207 isoform X2 [Sebastes umbrosus]|uniref:uncharacterized protein LOC119500207 isoform X2 n=1 Tax=Sebastes umbrosus TaxID=72105 RepID=UPI00189E5A5D|nr:uncharacterized protein LOC119500207 isoform X2 [Sebastes umbrosus]
MVICCVTCSLMTLTILSIWSSGLGSKEDLKYVKQEDIADLLPVIQQRKLIDAFKIETEIITLDLQVLPSPTTSVCSHSTTFSSPSGTSLLSCSESSGTEESQPSSHRKSWSESFEIPWNAMPVDLRSDISDGRRPSPTSRRQMVRVITDEMRKYEPNPTRSQCLTVCKKVVRQYPNSFADQLHNGQVLGNGYASLLIQVKNRIDNLNRTSSFRQHRSSSHGEKRGPTDIYGCARFQPSLPPDENENTVETKRQKLEGIYIRDGINGAERAEVKQLMETTFYLQRCHINALPAPTIEDLRTKWPYLFTQKGLYAHFEHLTDIPVLRTLELSMAEFGRTIVELLKTKPTNAGVNEVLSLGEDVQLSLRVIQLLMAHFSESITGLILLAKECATAADIEKTISIPETPRLILLGEMAGSCIQRWMISVEGHIICEGIQPTFLTGLAALFSCFYTFNLQYQEEAACTLEFIQRRFVGINPERGSKAGRGKVVSKRTGKVANKKTLTVNPNVSTLLRRLMDFEWDFI